MRVASGLESLVLGENEILGQVRSAAALAQSAGCSGPVLSALFRTAIVAGKRAHRETSLGSEGISVANLVVEMAEEMMGALDERTALLVGAGKISSMTARALTGAGLRWILVSNRTFERAQKLAQQLRGQAVHFDALEASLAQADIVICSTSAPHTVLHADEVQRAQERRHGRPMLIADLAVPRDADPDIDLIEGVQLVNIDGLESAMKRHHMKMNAACQQAEDISRQETQAFCRWFEERRCSAVIEALYHRAEAIYSAEAQHALSRMGPLSERQERAVQAMAKAIAGKLLHAPVTRLHELSAEKKIGSYLELTRDLYDLP
jgi:glutamyl-tRNA reductase